MVPLDPSFPLARPFVPAAPRPPRMGWPASVAGPKRPAPAANQTHPARMATGSRKNEKTHAKKRLSEAGPAPNPNWPVQTHHQYVRVVLTPDVTFCEWRRCRSWNCRGYRTRPTSHRRHVVVRQGVNVTRSAASRATLRKLVGIDLRSSITRVRRVAYHGHRHHPAPAPARSAGYRSSIDVPKHRRTSSAAQNVVHHPGQPARPPAHDVGPDVLLRPYWAPYPVPGARERDQ